MGSGVSGAEASPAKRLQSCVDSLLGTKGGGSGLDLDTLAEFLALVEGIPPHAVLPTVEAYRVIDHLVAQTSQAESDGTATPAPSADAQLLCGGVIAHCFKSRRNVVALSAWRRGARRRMRTDSKAAVTESSGYNSSDSDEDLRRAARRPASSRPADGMALLIRLSELDAEHQSAPTTLCAGVQALVAVKRLIQCTAGSILRPANVKLLFEALKRSWETAVAMWVANSKSPEAPQSVGYCDTFLAHAADLIVMVLRSGPDDSFDSRADAARTCGLLACCARHLCSARPPSRSLRLAARTLALLAAGGRANQLELTERGVIEAAVGIVFMSPRALPPIPEPLLGIARGGGAATRPPLASLAAAAFLSAVQDSNEAALRLVRETAGKALDPCFQAYAELRDLCAEVMTHTWETDRASRALSMISSQLRPAQSTEGAGWAACIAEFLPPPGVISVLCSCIANIDEDIMSAAIDALEALLASAPASTRHAVIARGLMPALSECLSDYNPAIVARALRALVALSPAPYQSAADRSVAEVYVEDLGLFQRSARSSGALKMAVSVLRRRGARAEAASESPLRCYAAEFISATVSQNPKIQAYACAQGAVTGLLRAIERIFGSATSRSTAVSGGAMASDDDAKTAGGGAKTTDSGPKKSAASDKKATIRQGVAQVNQAELEALSTALGNLLFHCQPAQKQFQEARGHAVIARAMSWALGRGAAQEQRPEAGPVIAASLSLLSNAIDGAPAATTEALLESTRVADSLKLLLRPAEQPAHGLGVLASACLLLSHICHGSPKNQAHFSSRAIVTVLVNCIRPPNSHPLIRMPALIALVNLCFRNPAAKDAVSECRGAIEAVLELLDPSLPYHVSATAARCIEYLVKGHARNAAAMLRANGLERLVARVNDEDEDELSKRAFSAMLGLGSACVAPLVRLVDAAVDCGAKRADTKDAPTQPRGASWPNRATAMLALLNGLVYSRDNLRTTAVEAGALTTLCRCLDMWESSATSAPPEPVEIVALLLSNLTVQGIPARAVSEVLAAVGRYLQSVKGAAGEAVRGLLFGAAQNAIRSSDQLPPLPREFERELLQSFSAAVGALASADDADGNSACCSAALCALERGCVNDPAAFARVLGVLSKASRVGSMGSRACALLAKQSKKDSRSSTGDRKGRCDDKT